MTVHNEKRKIQLELYLLTRVTVSCVQLAVGVLLGCNGTQLFSCRIWWKHFLASHEITTQKNAALALRHSGRNVCLRCYHIGPLPVDAVQAFYRLVHVSCRTSVRFGDLFARSPDTVSTLKTDGRR